MKCQKDREKEGRKEGRKKGRKKDLEMITFGALGTEHSKLPIDEHQEDGAIRVFIL
jgi:hypothetical protein